DGSGYGGMTGAAAVLYKNGRPLTDAVLRYQLGPITEHTTYDAEGIGILLGLQLIDRYVTEPNHLNSLICLDGRSAIEALESRLPKSGQNIIEATLRAAKRMAKTNSTAKITTVTWIPGHCGIEGNERADREARKAAEGNISAKANLPAYLRNGNLPAMASAIRQ
ncbi:ribonuclease H-like domain-containing protein, partial [Lentinula edodes]